MNNEQIKCIRCEKILKRKRKTGLCLKCLRRLPKSENWKKSRSKTMIGNQHPKGHKHSIGTRKKMSEGKKGDKCYLWKGGVSSLYNQIYHLFEYRLWRSDVFKKDDYTCQNCGLKGVYLEAHHKKEMVKIIKEYNIKTIKDALNCVELWDINNGQTLCKKCHNLTKKGNPKLYDK